MGCCIRSLTCWEEWYLGRWNFQSMTSKMFHEEALNPKFWQIFLQNTRSPRDEEAPLEWKFLVDGASNFKGSSAKIVL